MAKLILTAEYVNVNGTDISAYVTKGELQVKVDDKDVTTFGSGGWHEHLGGLKGGTFAFDCENDFAAGAIDSMMWPLLGTVVTFEIRPTQAARSASNPAYTGNVLITDWNPLSGQVGEDAKVTVSWVTTGVVTRQTT